MPQTIDVETSQVLPEDQPRTLGIPQVRLNSGTTFQSPFFWIIVGAALGIWLSRSRKVF